MDEVDLISRLAWFGGDPEIKVANPCIQLLFKCQILGIQTLYIRLSIITGYKTHLLCYNMDRLSKTAKNMSFYMSSAGCTAPWVVGSVHCH